jgi:hypothetical protein
MYRARISGRVVLRPVGCQCIIRIEMFYFGILETPKVIGGVQAIIIDR